MRVGSTESGIINTYFLSNTLQSTTGQSATYLSVIQGAAGATITFKVTTLSKSNPGGYYEVDGVVYNLNDTFTRVLNGSGQVSITQYINVGTSTTGNAIDVILTIYATTNGTIVPPNTTNISKTI